LPENWPIINPDVGAVSLELLAVEYSMFGQSATVTRG
jgi:hypothetical protein